MRRRALLACLLAAAVPVAYAPGSPADPSPDSAATEFFEAKVRPILAEHCQSCHGPDKQKNGLRLDSAAAVRKGGESGPAVTAGDPDKSRLIGAIRYTGEPKMPPKGKLPDEAIAA